jgi:hypothetical protein
VSGFAGIVTKSASPDSLHYSEFHDQMGGNAETELDRKTDIRDVWGINKASSALGTQVTVVSSAFSRTSLAILVPGAGLASSGSLPMALIVPLLKSREFAVDRLHLNP